MTTRCRPDELDRPEATPRRPTRRRFLRTAVASAASVSTVAALARAWPGTGQVIVEQAEGLLVVDPSRCTGCRRCELACTEFNDGRAQPSMARIQVGRNYNFGPKGQRAGFGREMGEYGNFRIVPDTCLQCPHPVPCATACPSEAIVLEPKTRARTVDATRCTGCRTCLHACPWEMIAFDAERRVATKCFLCAGDPECARACPTQAIRYVRWRDLTRAVPPRRATLLTRTTDSAGCSSCHTPAKRK